ncbi:MAG TPA: anti-sigma factor antagonist [Spirochaetaceae bacterium]|nr:anti-sigma factor antagonist [Spirochaetaceae bacterium]
MTIESIADGAVATISLTGWLDTQSAPEFETALAALGPETTSLVLDLKGLEYISSAGIRQVVSAYKKMNGALIVRNVSDGVMDVFNMSGVSKKLNIE